jgi:hypothetical protein
MKSCGMLNEMGHGFVFKGVVLVHNLLSSTSALNLKMQWIENYNGGTADE